MQGLAGSRRVSQGLAGFASGKASSHEPPMAYCIRLQVYFVGRKPLSSTCRTCNNGGGFTSKPPSFCLRFEMPHNRCYRKYDGTKDRHDD